MKEDDKSLFRSAVAGAKPLVHDRHERAPAQPGPRAAFRRADERAVLDEALVHAAADLGVESGDEILFHRPGVPAQLLRDLRRGRFAIEDELDLHGMVAAEARDAVRDFLAESGIDCFNACCKNIDMSLTPYEVVRLKKRLGMSSSEFLVNYTYPYEMEKDGIAGIKLKPVEEGTACQFMTEEGCSVYEDRPTACRYYPVALLSLRRQDEYTDRTAYALVQEAHCHGHLEDRRLTVDEYRKEQGLEDYDDLGRGWRQLILKKKSSGPTVGKPSQRSLQLFFMACYDVDQFREFIKSPTQLYLRGGEKSVRFDLVVEAEKYNR